MFVKKKNKTYIIKRYKFYFLNTLKLALVIIFVPYKSVAKLTKMISDSLIYLTTFLGLGDTTTNLMASSSKTAPKKDESSPKYLLWG